MHDETIPAGLCQCGCGGTPRNPSSRFCQGHHRRGAPIADKYSAEIPHGLCQCGCGRATSIATQTRAQSGHILGRPMPFVAGHRLRVPLEDRLWPKVVEAAPSDLSPNGWAGCWLWMASLKKGYGQIDDGYGNPLAAHRVAYELVVGVIRPELVVDHLCRRPRCVNPAHLEPVTQAVNCRRGLKSKLTVEQVEEARLLRAAGETFPAIAARYGVATRSIQAVVNRESWRTNAC